jgi:ubiquinone/menaquinone biosynthesis C-methylase UbiE
MCWMRAAARAFSSPVYRQARCRVPGDSSPALLGVARRRSGDKASLRLRDATRLPYPDRAFDLVLASTVLHQMPAGRAQPPSAR